LEAEGPEAAFIQVPEVESLPDNRIFGNQRAGQLIQNIVNTIDSLRSTINNREDQANEVKRLKREFTASQQSFGIQYDDIISNNPSYRQDIIHMLNKWFDVRFRTLHYLVRDGNLYPSTQEKDGATEMLKDKVTLINTLVHGGDLCSDTLLLAFNQSDKRHNQQECEYLTWLYQRVYAGLPVEAALWLSECDQLSYWHLLHQLTLYLDSEEGIWRREIPSSCQLHQQVHLSQ
jgi:hypothetical protein